MESRRAYSFVPSVLFDKVPPNAGFEGWERDEPLR